MSFPNLKKLTIGNALHGYILKVLELSQKITRSRLLYASLTAPQKDTCKIILIWDGGLKVSISFEMSVYAGGVSSIPIICSEPIHKFTCFNL